MGRLMGVSKRETSASKSLAVPRPASLETCVLKAVTARDVNEILFTL